MSDARAFRIVPPAQPLTPVLTRAINVQPTEVIWLAYGFLAAGKLTVMDGDPGLGKSTVAIDWAAKVTRGEGLFDASDRRKPRGVVLISDEDDRADTIRPRLEAAGADLQRVGLLSFENAEGEELLPEFPRDGLALADAVVAIDAALVIIDPLMLYLGEDVNANRDADVRRALAPVIKAAQRTGAAVLVLRHLTKGGGTNALYRGGGSIGIIGSARVGLMVARDLKTDESGRTCVLACFKNNLAPFPPSLAYQLDSAPNSHVARVHWLGGSTRTADSLLDTEERTQRDEADSFLTDLLADGARTAREIKRDAADAGLSWRAIERAKADLRVRVRKAGFQGSWLWELPKNDTIPQSGAPPGVKDAQQKSPEPSKEFKERKEAHPHLEMMSVWVCAGCGLPRSRDAKPCPGCGAMEGRAQ